jgi:altronate hydrolase
MKSKVLKVNPDDNVIVALTDLTKGETVALNGHEYTVIEDIRLKHKFAQQDFAVGDEIKMYGVLVGKATKPIQKGQAIHTENVKHDAEPFQIRKSDFQWKMPDVSKFKDKTFMGYHRKDGKVGTANYWIVVPLVFCENRNIKTIQTILENELGYGKGLSYNINVKNLIQGFKGGASADQILATQVLEENDLTQQERVFPHVDGIKFLTHEGGCGGIRQDSEALCSLLAGYITHPNVAGATVLSLGCQNAQISILESYIQKFSPDFDKPLYILEQQKSKSEKEFIAEAVKKTFAGLVIANQAQREPAPLSKLVIGLECGGSDGFSGISANPTLGQVSDLVTVLGGTAVLSEFPELNGVEQNLIDRCVDEQIATKFGNLMTIYSQRAKESGSGFDMNPSPGNIKDGLITDAMKSAGAAKKGGTSPVTDVLDYGEQVTKQGLNLLCTPGNDVESTTAEVASGCNIVLFTTGLGTPTGNPIAPVIKVASSTQLFDRMNDIIDFNTGTIITGEDTIETRGEDLLEFVIQVASGKVMTHATRLNQDDFIPWKRGVSL